MTAADDGFVRFPPVPTVSPLIARIRCSDHPAAIPDIDHKDVVDDNFVTSRWTLFTCSVCGQVLKPHYPSAETT